MQRGHGATWAQYEGAAYFSQVVQAIQTQQRWLLGNGKKAFNSRDIDQSAQICDAGFIHGYIPKDRGTPRVIYLEIVNLLLGMENDPVGQAGLALQM